MNPVDVVSGNSPLVLGLPHTGTNVPEEIAANLTSRGAELSDTDWHVHQLYDGLSPNVTTVRATFHRYVIDANRAPSGESLYPGQNTTDLVPLTDFDGAPLWITPPMPDEIDQRRRDYHAPYHAALEQELERVRAQFGVAILYDCHSIRSNIPYLFEGTLPDLNIGTNLGATCAPEIAQRVADICAGAQDYTSVSNGRFKGGWTTRHYGQPDRGIHAIQMELAQSTYLVAEKEPWTYSAIKAGKLRVHLTEILNTLTNWAADQ